MSTLVFVYGTLKEGFPNFGRNVGRRVGGVVRTRVPYPLYVVQLPGEDRAPWLVDSPGQGHPVLGQLFEVDAADLAAMDRFEEVGLPTGYQRAEVVVEAVDAPHAVLHAQAYLKRPDQCAAAQSMEGPFAEYTLALAVGYRLATT
ncbi:gamma-glutamylcyclotransferase family protein [Pseudorhodoferax sp.]|uniref:gamma-glutamylcyclotransferase family protein n=1 Tax=Pseudorhodoferax sp. TaxID=1993553 RepID=UPI002DD6AD22|nr:gamma-glutamylcyclotransferase family protein [Pseudorhodoferax sp.]